MRFLDAQNTLPGHDQFYHIFAFLLHAVFQDLSDGSCLLYALWDKPASR